MKSKVRVQLPRVKAQAARDKEVDKLDRAIEMIHAKNNSGARKALADLRVVCKEADVCSRAKALLDSLPSR